MEYKSLIQMLNLVYNELNLPSLPEARRTKQLLVSNCRVMSTLSVSFNTSLASMKWNALPDEAKNLQ
jgi:hypothetical protein